MIQSIAEKQALLKDAKAKYHAVMTGTSPRVVVDQNGERVEFSAANADKLAAYVRALELALCPGGVGGLPSGPATFTF